MQYEISNRMSDVHGSAIRELFKLGADPNMISFGGGNPSAETFPVPEIAEIMADVMKNAPVSVLQYGLSEGYTPLRDTMKEYLARTQGFDFEKNELFVVSGGQQCADLTTKVLVNEGDVILTEDPAFVGCLNTFRSYGAKLVGVPMQQDGMDIDALEAALKANPNAKLLYTIPSFQNPSGITTTLEKRKKVYELACKYDIAILEDNPYGELYYAERPPVSLRAFAPERTLRLGTMSKVLAPGFRLGYICGPKHVLNALKQMKTSMDLHTSTYTQLITARVLDQDLFSEHLPAVRRLYAEKAKVMLDSLEEFMPKHPEVSWTKPTGGMFIWLNLPKNVDSADLMKKVLASDVPVGFVPGVAFYTDNPEVNHCRLSFVTVPSEKIVAGIKSVAEALKTFL